jgi:hypothetical protein
MASTGFKRHRDRKIEMLCKKLNSGVIVYCLVAAAMPALAANESEGGDLRSAVQNPISSLISVPLKFTFDYGAENGEATILNINPVVPVTVLPVRVENGMVQVKDDRWD